MPADIPRDAEMMISKGKFSANTKTRYSYR